MKILLYNPDNGITRNFMPHLWMFLLKTLTPPGHEVILIDGNARPMNEVELVAFIRREQVGLVGIGAMTRMVARAYRMADAVRAAGVPVVMGGPHVTEVPDEALGRGGGQRHADSVALGEADETWPRIVADAAAGQLKEIYAPLVESGRGCPYGCEFCTVTGFFGDSIRFRTNESVVDELLRLKRHARENRDQVMVLIAPSHGKWIFIGMESIASATPADVNKGFNKPAEYSAVLARLARRNIYAVTSFIIGLDNDTPGVAERTLRQIETWPPGLPVFGQLTP